MGIEDHGRKGSADAEPPIAAFDFDGTLTVRDSFTDFLAVRFGPMRFMSGLARLSPAAIRYAFDRDRGQLKAALVTEFLKKRRFDDIVRDAERYADTAYDRLMRPDALATWRAWGETGAYRVIVTASPDLVVAPFARRLGADLLLGTQLAIDDAGCISGPLAGPNCRGPQKVVRLKAALGDDVRLAAAYGDTSGDREMLQLAAVKGWRVFRAKP